MWTLPNLLTLARIIAVVPLVAAIEARAWSNALVIFTVAALTDFLDGWIARRWRMTSEFGRFLDPLADKIIVTGVAVALIDARAIGRGAVIWAVIAIITREIAVSGLREYLGPRGVIVHVTVIAKWKTATQLVALGVLLAAAAFASAGRWPFARDLGVLGALLLIGSAILAWVSAWSYFRAALPAMRAQ